MPIGFQLILDKITSDPKKLFLIDSLGAVLTAFFLGVILVKLEDSIGMPKTALYFLASIACMFAVYSICCYFLLVSNWRPYLKGIAIGNLLYCWLTIVLVFYFYQKLTMLGLAYFVLELIVLSGLIIIEGKAIAQLIDRKN
jgi:hypothetical protein